MFKIRIPRSFHLFLSFALLVGPLPLVAIAEDINISLSEWQQSIPQTKSDGAHVYLGQELSDIAQVLSRVSELDNDKKSPLNELTHYIKEGFLFVEHDEIIQVLEYAHHVVQKNYTKLDHDDAQNLFYAIETFMEQIADGVLSIDSTTITRAPCSRTLVINEKMDALCKSTFYKHVHTKQGIHAHGKLKIGKRAKFKSNVKIEGVLSVQDAVIENLTLTGPLSFTNLSVVDQSISGTLSVNDIVVTGNVQMAALTPAGVVHNDASGNLSTSLVVNNDIANATISNAKLATISSSNIPGNIVVRDGSGNFATNMITLTGTVTNPTDAATKAYVDSVATGGLDAKAPAVVVSLTNVALSGLQTIDGVGLVANDRVLLVGQTNPVENGLWLAQAGAWTRPADFASGSTAGPAYVLILSGVNAGSSWLCNTPTAVIDTDPVNFVLFSLADSTTGANVGAGTGLIFRDKIGNFINFKSLIQGSHIAITNNTSDITIATDATSVSTPNTIVSRDVSGNFNANEISVNDEIIRNYLRFQDAAGPEYVGLQAPSIVPTSYTLSLPSTIPTANQILRANSVTPTDLEWVTLGGSVAPALSRMIYVNKFGNDTTGNGSLAAPYATLSKAITVADSLATSLNPITIVMGTGLYVENNSGGPLTITADGISIVGQTPNSVLIVPNTPTNNFLLINNPIQMRDLTFQSPAPLATAITMLSNNLSVLENIYVYNFLIGIDGIGGLPNSSYGFNNCLFINNGTALLINDAHAECNDCTFFGTSSLSGPAANTGVVVTGPSSNVVIDGGVFGVCTTGLQVTNNAICSVTAVSFRINTFDVAQDGASRMTLCACTFELTTGSSDIDVHVSGAGTAAEIVGCEFNGNSVTNVAQGIGLQVDNNAFVGISGGSTRNYTTALVVGVPGDTSSTILEASAFVVRDCATDIRQQGSSTLNFNASTATSSKVIINNPANININFFDLGSNGALTIGSTADMDSVLIKAAIDPTLTPEINYKSSLYSTQAIGVQNLQNNPSSLFMLSLNNANLTGVTTDRSKIAGLRLVSDTGSPVGGTSALRGWDINKNATSAELAFRYQNSDTSGQSAVPAHTVVQFDGFNNQVQLPTAGTQLVFAGDTNLYRSAANVLKTDDNFIVGTLTPNRVVITDPITNQLISSTVTNTELGYVSGVTSPIQTQLNNKVSRSGDSMTGALNMLTQNEVRFQDIAGGQYAGINAPTTITSSYTLSLPSAAPAPSQTLRAGSITANNLEWATEGGSIVPAISKTVYVTKYGNDTTGDGSFDSPYASLAKAVTVANGIATAFNPINIFIATGIYMEDNSAGPITVTADGVSLVGEVSSGVVLIPTTPTNDFLLVNVPMHISDIAIQSFAPLATGITLAAGNLTTLTNMNIVNFLVGVNCVGGPTNSYGFMNCFFSDNATALVVNGAYVAFNSNTIFGTIVPSGPSVNNAIVVTGAGANLVVNGGLIGLCEVGLTITNNSIAAVTGTAFRLNIFDVEQNGASRSTFSGCTFELTEDSFDIDLHISDPGTVAEIISCEFSGSGMLGTPQGMAMLVIDDALVSVAGGSMHNYATGIQIGDSDDTASTQLSVSGLVIKDCITDIVQEGSATLSFNASTASANKITINDPTNVNLAYFDLTSNSALTIGSTADIDSTLIQAAITTSLNPEINYKSSLYSTQAIGVENLQNNPSSLFMLSLNNANLTGITTDRSKIAGLRLVSDEGATVGGTSALRGWDINKNATSAELAFIYQNSDSSGQSVVPAHTVVQFDGFNNQVQLPTAGTQLIFAGDTNLYRSAANVLKTDDNLIVGTLTPNRVVVTDPVTNQLISSAVTNTELGYVSGVTSPIQTQLNNKVSRSGDSMTGALTMLTQNEIRLQDAISGYVGLKAPLSVPSSYALSFPSVAPVGHQMLRANGTTPTDLEWITDGGSVPPVNSRTIYVAKYGNDTTGDGSLTTPFLTVSKAITVANGLATTPNPVCILIAPGTYIENNSSGALTVTANGVSIVGDSTTGVMIMPSTPANNLLQSNTTIRIADLTLQSASPLATGLVLTTGNLSTFNSVRFVNFQTGVACSGGTVQLYGFSSCLFISNIIGLDVNDCRIQSVGCSFFGTPSVVLPAVNTGVRIVGSGANIVVDGGACGKCATGFDIGNNAIVTISGMAFKLNAFDIIQTGASHMVLNGSSFELTNNNADVDIQISGAGTIAEIVGCQFNGNNLLGIAEGRSILVNDNAYLDISSGSMKNYDTALQIGTSTDTASTIAFASGFNISNCTTDILQEGSATLNFNAGTASSSKISINDSTNVALAYFDVENSNILTIGSLNDIDTGLISTSLTTSSTDPRISYLSSLYSTQAIGMLNQTANPSTLYAISNDNANLTGITTDRTSVSGLRLVSDEGSPVGGTSALRGWDINKNATSAELSFTYQNSDIVGQSAIPAYTVVQIDGVNNQLQLPTAGTQLLFAGDTNLYRSSANVLKTDDNLIVGTLTPNRIVETDPVTNQLISSTVTNTELGYLSGVTSPIQTQLNSKVAKAGDTMTGTLIMPAGTAAAPSIQFTGSTNTGLSAATPNTLSFDTNGVERMNVNSTGVTINNLSTAGVVHNSAAGLLSTSLIVNADVDPAAAIVDTKLATISTAGKVANSATTATSTNTPNTIVLRDGSGNFSAGIITADLNGNATTATSAGSFSGSFSGDVTGTQNATVVSLVGGQTAANVAAATILANAATSANTASTLVLRDASGNFSAGTVSLTDEIISNSLTIIPFNTVGVVHNDAAGLLSTSLIVNADVDPAASIVDTKLATISTAGKVANSATTATSANTANTIVLRDGTGNFSAGTITANLSGNATTATSAGSFSGSLLGDVTGTQSATVVSLVGGQTASNVAAATVLANAATSANTASTIVRRDASGNFSAGAISVSDEVISNSLTITPFNSDGILHNDATGLVSSSLIVNADIDGTANIADTKLATISTAGKVANSATTATTTNTANTIVLRDGTGNFSAGTITANLSGNATTATSAGSFSGSLSGDVTGTQSATVVSLVGGQTASNVAAATVLANAATSADTANAIVRRDASGNFSAGAISVTDEVISNSLTITPFNSNGILHNDATGLVSSSLIVNADIDGTANIADTKLATISTAGKVANSATTATSTNTANTIVLRDASGNFSAGTITANLSGNATTATTATNFSGSLAGDVTGTQSATVVSLVGGQTASNVAAATVLANAATSANTASTIVRRDASGNFSAGAISVSDEVISNSLTVTPFNTAGVVHNNASGLLSTSLIVDADITNATITNAKLATISSSNTPGNIVVRDVLGNFATNMITLAGSVTNPTDAATKAYVDAAISTGIVAKTPAEVVSLTNQTLSGFPTIDGVTFPSGTNRVLLTGQTNPIQNGLWVVSAGAWTRPADFASGSTAGQAYVLILSGTTEAGSAWLCSTPTAIIDTDPISFALFSLADTTTGANVGVGTGLIFRDKTGSNINFKTLIQGSHVIITNNTDDITLATDATSANTANTIVARDGSGNFTASTITANLSGNATTATIATNFSGSLAGDVTGTQSATVVSLVGGQTASNVAAATVLANAATSANTASTIVKRDASGNFSAGTVSLTDEVISNSLTVTPFSTAGVVHNDASGLLSTSLIVNADIDPAAAIVDTKLATISTAGKVANSATTATTANTANTIVLRDGAGNFSAGTITANLNGNATTATSAGSFSGSLAGDVTGTQSATVVSLVGGQTASNVAAATVLANAATSANTASAIVRRDASGNFSAGTVSLTDEIISNSLTITPFNTTGVVHNNASGLLSTSLIVNADVDPAAAIVDTKLATISTAGKVANSATTATTANTANTIVLRDGAGNFSAGTITANLSGNATTATSAGSFSGSLAGDVTGTQSATVVSLVGGQTASNVAAATVLANAATSANTASTIVRRDASGNFSAGTVSLTDEIISNSLTITPFNTAGVVHNSAAGLLSTSLIVNADVDPAAAIVDTKLATISTAGKVANSATTATTANTANTIVLRDGTGNFSAGTITANLTGSASNNVLKAGDTMTGTLIHPAGTAAAPSIQFTGSTNTGISAATANTLSFDTNGVERMNVNSTGVTINNLSTAGVVHNSAAGLLSTSLIVNADVDPAAAIVDTKLATISTAGKVANSATTATTANTPNTIVLRDGSGNFSAGTITANLNGNATTATSAGSFSGSFSGDVTGTQNATVVSLVGGQTAANVAAATILANAATSANTASTIVLRDASGNFSAGAISVTDEIISNSLTITPFNTAGVVHNNSSGLLSTSLIVNADVDPAAGIVDTKLATISTAGKVANSATTATSANTPNTIVLRDGAGNFNAGTIVASLTGAASLNVLKAGDTMTGTLQLPAGTTALPSLVFSGSTTSGLSASAGTLSLSTNAIERLKIASGGSISVNAFTTAGVVHNDASGNLSSSLVTNADIIANAGIVDSKLATISTAGKVANSATTATSANTANTIVLRDSSGNFNAGTITANLTGNVTGNVTGSASLNVLKAGDTMTGALQIPAGTAAAPSLRFTGSTTTGLSAATANTLSFDTNGAERMNISPTGGVTINGLSTLGVVHNSAAGLLSTSLIVNADVDPAAGIVDTKLATISTAGKVANSATTATSTNTPNTIVLRDAGGNFSAGTITASLTGASSLNVLKAGDTMTGALQLPAGTTAVPSLVFTGSTTSGLSANTGNLSFSTNGLEQLKIASGGTISVNAFTTAGVVHNDASGNLSSSLVTNADIIANAGIVDTKLATISTAGKVANSATTATNANTANTIVLRDSLGNFSATTITADLIGNVTGNVTGAASLNVLKAGDTMTGTLIHPAGTAAAPSIQFTGSTNTGLSAATANTLSFDTNGVERMNVSSAGVTVNNLSTLGVVHNSAAGLLSTSLIVNADVDPAAAIVDTKLATISTAGKVANSATTATSTNTPNTIVLRDAGGNFSAGTITANLVGSVTGASSLNVLKAGDTMTGTLVHPAGTAAAPSIQFTGSTNTGISAATANTLSFDTNGAERMNINSTGVTINNLSTLGVVHNSAAGLLSTSLIVNADVDPAAGIVDTKLATISTAGKVANSATTATTANTANTIVLRNALGDFSAGTITANLNGNATTATSAGSFSGSLAGDVTGTQAATVVSLVGGQTAANVAAATVLANAATSANTASTIVRRDASGNFITNMITLNGTVTNPTDAATKAYVDAQVGGTGTNLNTPNTLVKRDGTGSFAAQVVSITDGVLSGNLSLSNSTSSTVGNIFKGGSRFIHNYPSGSLNTFVGLNSGSFSMTGTSNTALGAANLSATTTGANNTAVGATVLSANTTGSNNTAIGVLSLVFNTIGSNNTGVGSSALQSNTTGNQNTAIGYAALQSNTTAGNNTGIGYNALVSVTNGSNNIAIGSGSGATLTTGSGNIYIDASAATASESATTRIGTSETACYVQGIFGATTPTGTPALVAVDSTGKLGTATLTSTSANTPNTIVQRDGSGNFSAGTITANLSGNATTATTATNFSGSLAGDVTGTQSATVVSSVGGQTAANVAAATVLANAATSANTASTIVRRDASGNFVAGTITANLIGNVTGNVTGSASNNVLKAGDTMTGTLIHPAGTAAAPSIQFTGSTNTGISAATANTLSFDTNGVERMNVSSTGVTINNLSTLGVVHNSAAGLLSTSLIVNADVDPAAGIVDTKLATISTAGKVANSATTATSANTANTIVLRDASGNFITNMITINGTVTNPTDVATKAYVDAQSGGSGTNLNTPNTLVQRDGTGSFAAQVVSVVDSVVSGNLNLTVQPSTSTTGNILKNGSRFISNFGTNNIFVGLNSGNFTTTGAGNTAIGASALTANGTGANNTAIGNSALSANTSGSSNTAVGANSLDANTFGNNNTAIGNGSLGANTTGSGNTAIGNNALSANTIGGNNIAIGSGTLSLNTTGNNNTAIGINALAANVTGNNNIAIGNSALAANTTGNTNSAFGVSALAANTIGNVNTAVGNSALALTTTGNNNTGVGGSALGANTTGNANTAVGSNTLNATTAGNNNTAVGQNTLNANTTGNANSAFGQGAFPSLTTGNSNIAIGQNAGGTLTTGGGNIYINANAGASGENNTTRIGTSQSACYVQGIFGATTPTGTPALVSVDSTGKLGTATIATTNLNTPNSIVQRDGTGSFAAQVVSVADTVVSGSIVLSTNPSTSTAGNIFKGTNRFVHNFGTSNTFVGENSGNFTLSGSSNTGIGSSAAIGLTSGNNNTAVGSSALFSNTAGGFNTAIGSSVLLLNTTGVNNTGVGSGVLIANTTGTNNTAVGVNSLAGNTMGNNNTAIGVSALNLNTTGSNNTAVGSNALAANTTGSDNIAIGLNALAANTVSSNTAIGNNSLAANTTGGNNTGVGINTLALNTTGVNNTAVGAFALDINTTGIDNTALGSNALGGNTIGNDNTAVGNSSLASNTTGSANAAFGSFALTLNTTGINNTAIGSFALDANTIGNDNTAIGYNSLDANTTGINNTAIGSNTLTANTTGTDNTAIGFNALAVNATGTSNNTAVGSSALAANTIGTLNTAVGRSALAANTTGGNNTAVGRNALAVNTTGANNTAVGQAALAANTTATNNTAVGNATFPAVTSGSNNTAIGQGAGGTLTTGSGNLYINANARAAAEATTIRIGTSQNRAFIAGIRGVTTGQPNGVAVLVDSQGQLGTVSSSEKVKHNIQNMGDESANIYQLRPVTFAYNSDETETKQYGLIAEEVDQAFPQIVVKDQEGQPETVQYHVLPVLLLNEIKKQQVSIQELQKDNAQRDKIIQDLLERVKSLEAKA